MPDVNSLINFKIWTNTSNYLNNESKVVLQIIKKNKNKQYTLGYSKQEIKELYSPIDFNNIFIPKKFIDDNNLKIDDYVQFKFEHNLKTNELASRPLIPTLIIEKPNLTYKDTLIKLSLILSPIKESLFMNNKIEYTYKWLTYMGYELEYIDDESPLIKIL